METPDFSHLYKSTNDDYVSVYEPSNDSFLFLDALEKEIEGISCAKPTIVLEVGSGSGIISSFLSKGLKDRNRNIISLCTDINPAACKSTKLMNNLCSDVLNCDLVTPLMKHLKNLVDIILFNPPYVPTESAEVAKFGDITAAAWAGGINGTEVIFKFLEQSVDLLAPTGVLYMLIVKENNLTDIVDFVNSLKKDNPFKVTTVLSRQCRNELLSVIKFYY